MTTDADLELIRELHPEGDGASTRALSGRGGARARRPGSGSGWRSAGAAARRVLVRAQPRDRDDRGAG
jgi:hypothetical protein